jgi:hypothetical protein
MRHISLEYCPDDSLDRLPQWVGLYEYILIHEYIGSDRLPLWVNLYEYIFSMSIFGIDSLCG